MSPNRSRRALSTARALVAGALFALGVWLLSGVDFPQLSLGPGVVYQPGVIVPGSTPAPSPPVLPNPSPTTSKEVTAYVV